MQYVSEERAEYESENSQACKLQGLTLVAAADKKSKLNCSKQINDQTLSHKFRLMSATEWALYANVSVNV